jgi:hypothetical protein
VKQKPVGRFKAYFSRIIEKEKSNRGKNPLFRFIVVCFLGTAS